jgi:hypothetical protein
MATEDVLAVKLEVLHGDVVEIKTALNTLSEAITKLALVEQRQTQTAQALERAFKAISKIEARLSELEKVAPKGKETSDWVDRFILSIVACAAGYVGTKLGVL